MKKTINRLKLLRDYMLKKTKVSGLPIELNLEITNQCNLKCYMCGRQYMKRKIGFMDLELYQKIIDDISPFIELIYLHGLGEPLFHPQVFEMIKYAKSRGVAVGLSTNATIMTKEKSQALIDSGLDYLIVSIDAATPATYLKVRGGKQFKNVVKNTKEFLKLKTKSARSPFTVLQFIKNVYNKNEVQKFNQIWRNRGADTVRIKPVIDLLKEAGASGRHQHRPCFYLWRQLNMISWDGKYITPCCMDTEGDYALGDTRKKTIESIWNGPQIVALRKAHADGKSEKIALCQNCTYPQPSLPGRIGAMVLPEVTIKKLLPLVEKLSFGKFVIYD